MYPQPRFRKRQVAARVNSLRPVAFAPADQSAYDARFVDKRSLTTCLIRSMDKPSATPSPLDMQEFPCSAPIGPVAHAAHPVPEGADILHQCAGTYREMLSLSWARATLVRGRLGA